MIDEEVIREQSQKHKFIHSNLLKETHKFIMDFEFSMVKRTSIVVISGAISNSLEKFEVSKLEGRPLLLPIDEKARPMIEKELQVAVKEIKRIFVCKTELRDACLDQLKQTVTKSKELYSTYDNFNPNICKSVHEFLVCPKTHPLHSRSMRPICEIFLMQEPREVPENCEIRHVKMATTVLHKLNYKNEWLYVTNKDSLFITCNEDKESKNHILEGSGIISLNETCRGYANRNVLIPGRLSGKTQYTDFVPTSVIRELRE
ncbi:hypothetical protein AGLY_011947 [Aphis glycines]|uniref:Uncharacterized protein n=1 Tax=Aphis glycines TaxID=307491 RepID=A0A6G0TCH6_APHGL|nr:hypothetical protein AGLY_011947 [Aphis glycines]